MKQLHVITPVGLFPIPLARTKSLSKAKAQAEVIANRGVWVETIFLTPSIIRMIEIVEVPEKVASEGTEIEPVPVSPQLHDEEQEMPNE